MADNKRKITGKKRGRPENLIPWKKGQSGNPKGAPKRGESWREMIVSIGHMTNQELIEHFGKRFRGLSTYPSDITLKELVIINAYMSLLNDFNPKTFVALMERSEGKLPVGITVLDVAKMIEAKAKLLGLPTEEILQDPILSALLRDEAVVDVAAIEAPDNNE